MQRQIYELEIEVRARPGARYLEGVEGAFVRFYLSADDFMEAIEKMRNAVDVDHYALIEILLCRRLDLDEWEDERQDLFGEETGDYPDTGDLQILRDEDGWAYGPFYGYEDDQADMSDFDELS